MCYYCALHRLPLQWYSHSPRYVLVLPSVDNTLLIPNPCESWCSHIQTPRIFKSVCYSPISLSFVFSKVPTAAQGPSIGLDNRYTQPSTGVQNWNHIWPLPTHSSVLPWSWISGKLMVSYWTIECPFPPSWLTLLHVVLEPKQLCCEAHLCQGWVTSHFLVLGINMEWIFLPSTSPAYSIGTPIISWQNFINSNPCTGFVFTSAHIFFAPMC